MPFMDKCLRFASAAIHCGNPPANRTPAEVQLLQARQVRHLRGDRLAQPVVIQAEDPQSP